MAAPPADLVIRPLRPGDDPDAQLDLSERAFGPGSAADRDRRIRSLSRLIEALEDSDDVQDVYANYSVPDEVMEKLG